MEDNRIRFSTAEVSVRVVVWFVRMTVRFGLQDYKKHKGCPRDRTCAPATVS